MLLKFPTGSISESEPDVVAAMYFKNDGSWFMNAHEEITEESRVTIEDFVQFVAFAAGREDIIQDFFKQRKKDESIDYDSWRRDNFRLIKNPE